jgi:hypothetical protein
MQSRRFLSGPSRSAMDWLPDDALSSVATYLEGRDLVRLQRVSKRMKAVGRDTVAWSRLLRQDFEGYAGFRQVSGRAAATSGRFINSIRQLASGVRTSAGNRLSMRGYGTGSEPFVHQPARPLAYAEDAYMLYKQRYEQRLLSRQRAKQRQLDQQIDERTTRHKHRIRLLLDYIQFPLCMGLPCFAIPIWLLFLLLKLKNTVDWSWFTVFLPILVMVCMVAGAFLLGCLTQIASDTARSRTILVDIAAEEYDTFGLAYRAMSVVM